MLIANYLGYMRKRRKVIFHFLNQEKSEFIDKCFNKLSLERFSVDDLSVHYLQIKVWETFFF